MRVLYCQNSMISGSKYQCVFKDIYSVIKPLIIQYEVNALIPVSQRGSLIKVQL